MTAAGSTGRGPDGADVTVRAATADDLPALVALLADDDLGATRESPDDLAPYVAALAAVEADPHQALVVAEADGRVVGTLQLSVIPGLARTGALRGQIEAVRVHADRRADGIGSLLVRWAVDEATRRGCRLVQLTSDASRTAAHRFYERLGFAATHVGFKLDLGPA